MKDRRVESYILGSSLSARRSSVLKIDELRFCLKETSPEFDSTTAQLAPCLANFRFLYNDSDPD